MTRLARLFGSATLAVILCGLALAQASAQTGPAATQGAASSAAAPGAPPAAPLVPCSPFGYARAANFGVGINPDAVAVGDFNRDGNPDLAAANQLDNTVSVLLGNGAGGFGAATTYPVGANRTPTSFAVGDFNHDGNPDLVVGARNTTLLIILLGDGAGNAA